jgi:hypothetical protein
MKKGEFDDVFRYELDDENWRPAYILYKLTSIKLAKCKIIISYVSLYPKVKFNFLYINLKDNKTMLVFSQPHFSQSKVYK